MVESAYILGGISIALGGISIALAVGLNVYRNRQENRRRINSEEFFVKQIKINLQKMAQYFLDVERTTTHNEDYETSNDEMMRSLKTFYRRNEQEMKDILYQSKLYLPFWYSLTAEDKAKVNEIFDTFSWLLYDYYQSNMPESIRELMVLQSRSDLYRNKDLVVDTADGILRNTEPQI